MVGGHCIGDWILLTTSSEPTCLVWVSTPPSTTSTTRPSSVASRTMGMIEESFNVELYIAYTLTKTNNMLCDPQFLRYQGFPSGLGKGHDAASVGSWLAEMLQQLDASCVVPRARSRVIIFLISWTKDCVGLLCIYPSPIRVRV